ncbi:MAG: arylsulfatase [Erythrobacter sp.]|uniref:arylsulfatase B n=1 Tax=Erythrobacter sp. TaxID=1042 RepID=UPI003299BBE6
MKKRNFVLLIAAGNFLAACSVPVETEAGPPIPIASLDRDTVSRPNVIFILVDDMGFGDVGYNGSEIATPNLDQMASAGMTLDRNYVYPICSPTRTGLLTGSNPLDYGIDGPMAADTGMPRDLKIMPEYFKELGYQTFMVGKWHLGKSNTDYWPISRGFDSHYGFLSGFIDFYSHVYAGGLDWQKNGVSLREEGHATDLFTAEAKRVIDTRDTASPFFLYLAYNAPHAPLQTTPEDSGLNSEIKPGNRFVYAEMVTQLDDGIGQLIDELEKQGILENTIVVFSSDNGGSLSLGSSNGDLRGAKGSSFEGGVRVPGLIMWANHIKAGEVLTQQIVVQDWLPTLLDAVGGNSSNLEKLDGQSMWQAIDRGVKIDRAQTILGSSSGRAVFDWPWKLVRMGADGEHQLYNVIDDPYEQEDLAREQPEILAKLAAVLEAMPDVPTRRAVNDAAKSGSRSARNTAIDYEARAEETRSPWAEAAVRGRN